MNGFYARYDVMAASFVYKLSKKLFLFLKVSEIPELNPLGLFYTRSHVFWCDNLAVTEAQMISLFHKIYYVYL